MTITALDSLVLRVADLAELTEAEGPGRRFAVWFQGCPLGCPGCCNPEMQPLGGGRRVTAGQLLEDIGSAVRSHGIEGITLEGGEPFAQAAGAAAVAAGAREHGLTVMVFSGYTLEELRKATDSETGDLLACTDILVDGRFVRDQPECRRRWIGSGNQQVHFLTDRYRADDPRWLRPNTMEIQLRGTEVLVTGFPVMGAMRIWKRVGRVSNLPNTANPCQSAALDLPRREIVVASGKPI